MRSNFCTGVHSGPLTRLRQFYRSILRGTKSAHSAVIECVEIGEKVSQRESPEMQSTKPIPSPVLYFLDSDLLVILLHPRNTAAVEEAKS